MPLLLQRKFLFFSLLRSPGSEVLEEVCERLSDTPAELNTTFSVSRECARDALIGCCEKLGVLRNQVDVVDYCTEAGDAEVLADAFLFLGRGLEAAAVAYGIGHFSVKYRAYLESRLFNTQGLSSLIQSKGKEVLQEVADLMEEFRGIYVSHTLAAQATIQNLLALKRARPDIYALFQKHRAPCHTMALRHLRKLSLSLDDQERELEEASKQHRQKLSRRSYSVDVQAGISNLQLAS